MENREKLRAWGCRKSPEVRKTQREKGHNTYIDDFKEAKASNFFTVLILTDHSTRWIKEKKAI